MKTFTRITPILKCKASKEFNTSLNNSVKVSEVKKVEMAALVNKVLSNK